MFKDYGGKIINLAYVTHYATSAFRDGKEEIVLICFVGGSTAGIDIRFLEEFKHDLEELAVNTLTNRLLQIEKTMQEYGIEW